MWGGLKSTNATTVLKDTDVAKSWVQPLWNVCWNPSQSKYQLCVLCAFPPKMMELIYYWISQMFHKTSFPNVNILKVNLISNKIWPPVVLWHQQLQKWIVKQSRDLLLLNKKSLMIPREVIRIRKSKRNRQHNSQKKTDNMTHNDLQNIHKKLKIE